MKKIFTPLNHAVESVGILIGNILGLNAVGVMILGRMFDYLFYVLFCYFAIKNMKYYKTLIHYFEKNEDTKISIKDIVLLLICGLFIHL